MLSNSEASRSSTIEILRFAQNDNASLRMTFFVVTLIARKHAVCLLFNYTIIPARSQAAARVFDKE